MTDFNALRCRFHESAITIYSVEHDWTTWVGLNHDVDVIPTKINLYKDHPDRDFANEKTTESGKYIDLEWAREPDWFRIETWWRGWIPTGGGTDFSPWYLDLDALAPYATASNCYAFTDTIREEMKKGLRDLQEGIDAILEEHAPPPMTNEFSTGHSPRSVTSGSRRRTPNAPRWTEQDGFADWQAIDLPFWLYYSLPIYYTWGFDEKNDPRFSRLHPQLIELADDDHSLVQEGIGLTLEADLLRAAAASWNYDDYLTTKPVIAGSLSSYDSDSKFTVIDFEGWGRHYIHEDEAPAYATQFHFTTSTDEESGHPITVFWRWKPREYISPRQIFEKQESRAVSYARRSALWYIREMHAHALTPSPTRSYHLVTGAQVYGDTSSLEKRLAERAWDTDSNPYAEGDDMSLDASEIEEPARRTLKEHLDVRMAPRQDRQLPARPSLSNMTMWKNFAPPSHTRRSRSPTARSPILRNMPPHQRPATIFRIAYQEIAGKLTYIERLFPVVDPGNWNTQFLCIGYLHVPDWHIQVRMRFFANCVPSIRHIRTILSIAVEHKMSFQIAIRAEDFHFFGADVLSQIDQRLVKAMYKPGFTEPQLSYSSPSAFVNAYIGKLADILRRPHARTFIGLGGPFSWLAQRWGGTDLVDRFMEGPSIQVTRYFSSQNDSGEDRALGIHWDCVSDQEIEFLFGYIPADKWNPERWLYPPISILDEACDHWTGEWNVGMEEIFRHITSQVTRNPTTAAPKTRRGWMEFLRSYN
ncbi:hypothetical protein M413DRAFT_12781 [Hebeloma cylindrosporum]|uniref:Uncharacterized protein n=1 Tax=Hebeloma cylindrosporum TaxID=76867 RepID=A0A0C3BNP9_HEBCY|nr:hypothetical protein M413DRAFT_12781 [Hebeloma cylindrosporum h7]